MPQIGQLLPVINGLLKTFKVLLLTGIPLLLMNGRHSLQAQSADPVQCIRDLKEGYLIVRFPSSKAKIDTLQAMVSRSTDSSTQKNLQKQLDEAIEERDTLLTDYIKAFREVYHFSKVAYFFDYDSHHSGSAHYYRLDSTEIPKEELSLHPVFYMYFERTSEGEIEALVIRTASGEIVPPPFPNNFSRSGINFLFLKISQRTFPEWRVDKINKQLSKYWSENREP